MLTVAGTLQVLRMLATETRIVSLAVWLRLKMPFSTEDKIFATGIFFGAIEKLKQQEIEPHSQCWERSEQSST